ncbi:N-acetylmuramoyl-L-alanine amidase [Acidimicrobiia bacterium EGI L10123]|uniref:N-acetylmuramoyl-L-alanine amidase family protein n=1 Tax=Salinilacustrithrix flava TaxID=2957203 RepID=UPI003D7C3574|nr:N-acetylmuramoyl-L-alanine amidase [Acidimicrobiia bacterium EGI L10123]
MFARLPPLARLALASLVLIALAWAIFGRSVEDDIAVVPDTTDTTEPSVFGPVPTSGAGAVLLEGLVLPITGGSDGAWTVLTPCANTATVDGERLTGAHVVIDPGHGGRETGAIGPSGVVEAELNLDVALKAKALLEEEGATVALTRNDDTRVTLETRAAIAQGLAPLLFISIHHNGGPTRTADRPGVQVYHQHQTPESARFAGVLFEQLQEAMAPFSDTWSGGNATGVRSRLGEDGGDFYGVLRGSEGVPAVLAEAMYMSHEPEASLLLRDDVRQAEAQAITDAIVAWLESPYAGSGYLPPLQATESAGGGGGSAGCEDPELLRTPA